MYKAEILLDSINPLGVRLTTMKVTMPRFILAEFNTHRVFSRNAASSRAMPIAGRIHQVRNYPFVPDVWGKNQRGMQATIQLEEQAAMQAEYEWIGAANAAADYAERLSRLGVHKQLANRILEPYCWVDVIVSSTKWDNFFHLRDSNMAQPEMQIVAKAMRKALDESTPQAKDRGEWHIPCGENLQGDLLRQLKAAAGRIARVSYNTGSDDPDADAALGERLVKDGHWSPFEHIAVVTQSSSASYNRNFGYGWDQFRAFLEGNPEWTPST